MPARRRLTIVIVILSILTLCFSFPKFTTALSFEDPSTPPSHASSGGLIINTAATTCTGLIDYQGLIEKARSQSQSHQLHFFAGTPDAGASLGDPAFYNLPDDWQLLYPSTLSEYSTPLGKCLVGEKQSLINCCGTLQLSTPQEQTYEQRIVIQEKATVELCQWVHPTPEIYNYRGWYILELLSTVTDPQPTTRDFRLGKNLNNCKEYFQDTVDRVRFCGYQDSSLIIDEASRTCGVLSQATELRDELNYHEYNYVDEKPQTRVSQSLVANPHITSTIQNECPMVRGIETGTIYSKSSSVQGIVYGESNCQYEIGKERDCCADLGLTYVSAKTFADPIIARENLQEIKGIAARAFEYITENLTPDLIILFAIIVILTMALVLKKSRKHQAAKKL